MYIIFNVLLTHTVMRKVLLSLTSMMLVVSTAFAQIQVGAGYLNSADRVKANEDADANTTYLNGFYVGGGYSFRIVEGLKVTPGLYYAFAMRNDADQIGPLNLKGDVKEHYLNVPVMLSYGYGFTPDCKVFAYAGPTFSVGLSSRTTLSANVLGFAKDTELDNYDEDYDYSRVDCLLVGGLGMDLFKHYRIQVGYDFGLVNRYSGDGDPIRHRNQFTAGVAYVF